MDTLAPRSLAERIDALFSRWAQPGSPGAVVGVMRAGEVELIKGYGLASIEHGVPIGEHTRFRIASVSKQFTVTAALMLAAEGKLDLAAPPHKYLRELPKLKVTIDQMMRNCSGLPDFLELLRLGGHGLDKPARPDDLLAACVRNRHLNFAPNSRFLYSNSNFLLLGIVVERLTGKTLGEVLAERIFRPLGMDRTALVPEIDAIIPGLATGYLGDSGQGFRRSAHAYPQGGEGGLTSTVGDLLTWSRHFDRPTLVPRDLPRQLVEPSALTGGHANGYRRGVGTGLLRGIETVGHGGLWPGFRTEFLRLPSRDLTVVVIANLASIDPWRLARAVAVEALGLGPPPFVATEEETAALAGTWFNALEPSLFDLAWRNGEPTVTMNGLPFALAKRGDGWLEAERGSFEFALKLAGDGSLQVDVGAGRVLRFARLTKRKPAPAAIVGRYRSADSGATWQVRRAGKELLIDVGGPLVAGGPPWRMAGIDADTVEIVSPSSWITATQLARLDRGRTGKIKALLVTTGRIKGMRFERVA